MTNVGRNYQRPAQTPRRELSHLVQVRSRIDILPRVRVVPDATPHLRLLDDVAVEARPVQEGVRLDQEEDYKSGNHRHGEALYRRGTALVEGRGD